MRRLLIMSLLTVATVLDAVQIRLTDAKMPAIEDGTPGIPLPGPAPKVALFESVRITSKQSYLEAVGLLREESRRICLIHPMGLDYDHRIQGAKHELRRSVDLMLMIGTEDYTVNRGTMADQPGGRPGLLTLAESAVNALALESLGLAGPDRPICIPGAGVVVQLTFQEKDAAGEIADVGARECFQQLIRISAGILTKQLY